MGPHQVGSLHSFQWERGNAGDEDARQGMAVRLAFLSEPGPDAVSTFDQLRRRLALQQDDLQS